MMIFPVKKNKQSTAIPLNKVKVNSTTLIVLIILEVG